MNDSSYSSQHVQYKNTGLEEYDDGDIRELDFMKWAVFVDGIWTEYYDRNENKEVDPFEELQFF